MMYLHLPLLSDLNFTTKSLEAISLPWELAHMEFCSVNYLEVFSYLPFSDQSGLAIELGLMKANPIASADTLYHFGSLLTELVAFMVDQKWLAFLGLFQCQGEFLTWQNGY